MRVIAFLVCLFCFCSSIFGVERADSLTTLLNAEKRDTARIRLLNELAKELKSTGDFKKSLEAANDALKIALKINNPYGIASSYNSAGIALHSLSQSDTALYIFSKALSMKSSFRDEKLEAFIINNIGMVNYVKGNRDLALENYNKSLAIRERIKDIEGIASTYNNIGNLYVQLAQNEKGLGYLKKSLFLREKLGDKKAIASTYHNIANTYYGMADYPRSMENYHKCLKIRRELGDRTGIGATLNNLGAISRVEKDYKNAIAYFTESMEIRKELGNKMGMAIAINNLGNIYYDMQDLDKARGYFQQSLDIRKEINDKKGMAIVLTNLGSICSSKKEYKEALEYYNEAMKIQDKLEDFINAAVTYNEVGELYLNTGNSSKAIEYGTKSIKLTENTSAIMEQKLACELLYNAYKKTGNVGLALKFHEKMLSLNDSIYNTEKNTKVNIMKTRFALDQQEAELKSQARTEKDRLQATAKMESEKQRMITYSVAAGLVMLLVFSGFLFNRFQVIRKQKYIIENQKQIVEEKNRDITDSINYAKRIQSAILSPKDEIARKLQESFILYKPKDIVSGDFYYLAEKGNKVVIAVADCTGHGVPGAFMSLIGNNILDKLIKEQGITNPSVILGELHTGIHTSLHQENSESESRDGMDIALCTYDKATREIEYSGAMRNLYVVGADGTGLSEIKSDKLSIGGMGAEVKVFKTHRLPLQKGDTFYLFSDGYADQFGGPDGKKFMTKRLKELLINIKNKPMTEQLAELDHTIMSWKGDLEQVDDICVIGVRV